jgi:hypothetical protein
MDNDNIWPQGNTTGVDRRSANGVSATGAVKLPRGLRPSSPSADSVTMRVPCALSPQIALLKLDLLLFLAMLGATGFAVLYLGRANSFYLKPRPFFLADTSLWVCRTEVSLSILLGIFVPLSMLLDMQPKKDCAVLSQFYHNYVGEVFIGFCSIPTPLHIFLGRPSIIIKTDSLSVALCLMRAQPLWFV